MLWNLLKINRRENQKNKHMDKDNENLIKQKIDSLPKDFRDVIKTINPSERSTLIAQKNGLHIDKADILSTLVGFVMLDIIKPELFIDSLVNNLEIDKNLALKISDQVKNEILLPIRNLLIENTYSKEVSQDENIPKESTNRASILSEIENPTPTTQPISIADQTISGPAAQKEVVTDLVASKLATTVTIPSQPVEKPKSYAADPYREPLA